MVISIIDAEYVQGYKIKFHFSDRTLNVMDFEEFLSQSKNPMTRKYLDIDLFKNFSIKHGDIQWNDYELCFPIWNLYEGKL